MFSAGAARCALVALLGLKTWGPANAYPGQYGTSTETTTSTGDASNVVAEVADLNLGSTGMTLALQPIGDGDVEFEVRNPSNSWIGIGLTSGNSLSVSMSGSGEGSDVVTCSSVGVLRYSVTAYALSGGEEVPGASCTQESGVTTLKFTRSLAASSGARRLSQVEITPGVVQGLIFARGDDGDFFQKQHSIGESTRGGQSINFAAGVVTVSPKRSAEAVLFFHLVLMSVAWGALLPLGAIISNRFRAQLPETWIHWHRNLQMAGWALQLVGCIMAIIYVELHSAHFSSFHTFIGLLVVIVGTLQPVNALLRPHRPEEGQVKTRLRATWELMHKGLGWLAVVLGMLNLLFGIILLVKKGYDSIAVGVASLLAIVCIAAPLGAVLFSCVPRSSSGEAPGKGQP